MSVTIPANFSGEKLAAKFNLGPFDFWVSGNQLTCPSLPNLTAGDVSDCVVTAAELATMADQDQAAQQLRDDYQDALTALNNMIDDANMTNAEAVANIKILARILRYVLKTLARRYR